MRGERRTTKNLLSADNRFFEGSVPEGIRTPDRALRRRMLYPAELPGHKTKVILERVMGIEPTPPAWEAGVLPLNYTRNFF
jgi:hypothetical protein